MLLAMVMHEVAMKTTIRRPLLANKQLSGFMSLWNKLLWSKLLFIDKNIHAYMSNS